MSSQTIKVTTKAVSFPPVCPHCLETATTYVTIASEEKIVKNYIFFSRWKYSKISVPFCTTFAKRERKAYRICFATAFGLLAAYILFQLIAMRPVAGNEIYFVVFSFFGILWMPPLFAGTWRYIKIVNATDDFIDFQIRNPRYAKMFADLNGVSPPEKTRDKKDDDNTMAFGA